VTASISSLELGSKGTIFEKGVETERELDLNDSSDILDAESVEAAAGTLESVDDIEGSDGLALGVFGVSDRVTDNVLEEDLEHATRFLVDQPRDTLDTAASRQTTDSRLRDTLDVISQDFAMTLRASLSQTLSTFSTSGHVALLKSA